MSTLGCTWRLGWEDKALIKQRLLRKRHIESNGCWIHTGAGDPYVTIRIEGRHVGVHVAAAWVWKGIQGTGRKVVIRHTCDTPACFNPKHLRKGAQRLNVWDSIVRGHRPLAGTRTMCAKGHVFDAKNTYWWRGYQHCRECHRLYEKQRRADGR